MTSNGVTFEYKGSERWNITSNTTRTLTLTPINGRAQSTINLTANVTYTFAGSSESGYVCLL